MTARYAAANSEAQNVRERLQQMDICADRYRRGLPAGF